MAAKTYRTIQNDTFDTIAYRICGDEMQCVKIMEANPDYMDVLLFPAGVELNLPELKKRPRVADLPPWMRK